MAFTFEIVDKCIQKHTEKATERSRHADKGKHIYSMLWDLSNCGRPNCWPINVTPDSSHNLFHSFGPTECIPVPCSFDFTGKQCAVHIVHLMTRLIAHFFLLYCFGWLCFANCEMNVQLFDSQKLCPQNSKQF